MAIKLSYEEVNSKVLPEILTILEQMVQLYNDWEGPTYLKLWPVGPTNSETTSRYIPFKFKSEILEMIEANCPPGCILVTKK